MSLMFCHRAISLIFDLKNSFTIHLLSCKDQNSKSMTFFQHCESLPFKASTKNGVHQYQQKKHMKDSHFFSTITFDFLALVEDFFHYASMVLDLKPYV